MAVFGGYEILVTPEELAQKANIVSEYIHNIKSNFEDMEILIHSSNAYWEGDAGDKFREYYDQRKEDIEASLRNLLRIPQTLNEISGVYTNTENAITETVQELPGDVIE